MRTFLHSAAFLAMTRGTAPVAQEGHSDEAMTEKGTSR